MNWHGYVRCLSTNDDPNYMVFKCLDNYRNVHELSLSHSKHDQVQFLSYKSSIFLQGPS